MSTYLVLTVIGDDRPGLVEALARVIDDCGGNWLECRMSQLAGKFAGILRVSVTSSDAKSLVSGLQGLSSDLKLVIEQVEVEQALAVQQTIALSLVANDRHGIVKEISQCLSGLSINVEQLTTECSPAPMSGDYLFRAQAVLKAPQGVPVEALKRALEQLSDDLIVEVQGNPPGVETCTD